jgi:hypothetical protein
MQKRGWIAAADTSLTGRAMSVTVTDAGKVAFTRTSNAWRRAQADAAKMLGPNAASMLDEWLDVDIAAPPAEPTRKPSAC